MIMRQLLVECSDPGLVVSLAEEFENVLRRIDFDRARALHGQLAELARELGPEFEEAWRGFRIEVPSDGDRPLAFGNRDKVDEGRLKQLLARAGQHGLGQFKLRDTLLLPQGGPAPETREQYIRDLADGIRWASHDELRLSQRPVELPGPMAAHRQQLLEEYGAAVLRARACFPTVGHPWVRDSVQQLEKALQEVNTRAEAVMEYELDRLDPVGMEPDERVRWAALAVRLGKAVERWCLAAEEPLDYLYQRAALAALLWDECDGWGPARPFLEKQLQAFIQQAETVYTADGQEALRRIYDELHRSPWDKAPGSLAGKEAETEDEDEEADIDD